MNSKTIYYLTAGLLILFTITTTSGQSIKNEVQVIEGSYGIEKKRIIDEAMNVSGGEALLFWSIYDAYENKRRSLSEERLFLIYDYMVAYPVLTDKKASEITKRLFKNDKAVARLHKQYYKKVRRALTPLKAAQFLQVESFLENSVRMQLQSRLPIIGHKIPTINNPDNSIKQNGTL